MIRADALPVLSAERESRVLGFARTVGEARAVAGIWAAAHGQHLLGLVCSRKFHVDPTRISDATFVRAQASRRAWVALLDDDTIPGELP